MLILGVALLIRSSARRKALARPLSLGFPETSRLITLRKPQQLLEMPSDLIFCTEETKKIPSTIASATALLSLHEHHSTSKLENGSQSAPLNPGYAPFSTNSYLRVLPLRSRNCFYRATAALPEAQRTDAFALFTFDNDNSGLRQFCRAYQPRFQPIAVPIFDTKTTTIRAERDASTLQAERGAKQTPWCGADGFAPPSRPLHLLPQPVFRLLNAAFLAVTPRATIPMALSPSADEPMWLSASTSAESTLSNNDLERQLLSHPSLPPEEQSVRPSRVSTIPPGLHACLPCLTRPTTAFRIQDLTDCRSIITVFSGLACRSHFGSCSVSAHNIVPWLITHGSFSVHVIRELSATLS
jgi:hypothetical protein